MKKVKSVILSTMILACMIISGGQAVQAAELEIVPFDVGVNSTTSTLTISTSGVATCSGTVRLQGGYTADVTVTLKRDGSRVTSWTASGSGSVKAGGTYTVTKGHSYVVTTTAKIYDANGKQVDTVSKDSTTVSY